MSGVEFRVYEGGMYLNIVDQLLLMPFSRKIIHFRNLLNMPVIDRPFTFHLILLLNKSFHTRAVKPRVFDPVDLVGVKQLLQAFLNEAPMLSVVCAYAIIIIHVQRIPRMP
jgi:hypothetical protein